MFAIEGHSLVIRLRSLLVKLVFTALVLAVAAPLIHRAWCIFMADRIVRSEQTVESYTRALKYNPSDATLWWHRGRLEYNSVTGPDMTRAMSDYKQALSLNPRLGQAWADLAACYEQSGDAVNAEAALEKACATRPYSPGIRWQTGNFHLRRGNFEKMYPSFRLACEYDVEKLPIALDLAWKADSNHARILKELVPDRMRDNLRYLEFLLTRDELGLAREAWTRSLSDEIPADNPFKPAVSFRFIDRLLALGGTREAMQVWDEALLKAGTSLRETRNSQAPVNLVWNGSFENEILRGGFDWRYSETPEFRLQIDLQERLDGLKSLRIVFGDTNIAFYHLSQIVPVPRPGDYTIEFYLKTDGLTTDQTPYLGIAEYPETGKALLRTSMFPETTPWRRMTASFTVGEDCSAILLGLHRNRSLKLGNALKGTLWLDNIKIYRSTA